MLWCGREVVTVPCQGVMVTVPCQGVHEARWYMTLIACR